MAYDVKHFLLTELSDEMEESWKGVSSYHGSAVVLKKLKEKGHYPYSDLDREPVF